MKKILVAIVLAAVVVSGVAGCSSGTDKLQAKIDQLQATIGEMNQTLSEMDDKFSEMEDKIDGLERELIEMSPGIICSVKEAYNNGWLMKEDLMSIAYYHNGGRTYNEDIMSEDYAPLPKTPLDEITEYKVKCATAKDYSVKYKAREIAEEYIIDQYCGTYNGCAAVMAHGKFSGSAAVVWTDTVDGVNFYYTDGYSLIIWKDGITPSSSLEIPLNVGYIFETGSETQQINLANIIDSQTALTEYLTAGRDNGLIPESNSESILEEINAKYSESYFETKALIPAYFSYIYLPDDFRCGAYAVKEYGKLVAVKVNYFIRHGSNIARTYKIVFLEINKIDCNIVDNDIPLIRNYETYNYN